MKKPFDYDAETARKSNLLLLAAMLRDASKLEEATERYAEAAQIEERLADDAARRSEALLAVRHLYSAASAWAHAGDFRHAVSLLRAIEQDAATTPALRKRVQAFTNRVQQERERWSRSLQETAAA